MRKPRFARALAIPLLVVAGIAAAAVLHAQVPQILSYQGRVAVGAPPVNFDGTGQFKFALVNAAGTTTFWSNDGTSVAGSEPTAAVSLTVTKGLYSVLLGDTALANMTAIPNAVFSNSDVHLRVWFNDGVNGSQQLSPDQRIAAVGYAMMAGNVPDGAITGAKLASGAAAANLSASSQSVVPSGGMILSSTDNDANLLGAGYLKLGKVDLGDVWDARTGGTPPSARYGHTAVWTGTEMIVWGGTPNGSSNTNDGARYNPATNTWTAVAMTDAPSARVNHTAVWTGTEMIIWGGSIPTTPFTTNDGGRYNPATDSWTATILLDAPGERRNHTAVWTGSEMIVWGGVFFTITLTDGGRYNPAANTWAAVNTTGAPSVRIEHTAVWTGSVMIVWGGLNAGSALNTGGRYNPASNTWAGTSTGSGVPSARYEHTVVWTGTEMIVAHGRNPSGSFNDGGRYLLSGNSWTAINTTGAPTARSEHTAVWTGSEMILWGGTSSSGLSNVGGRYAPLTNSWSPMTTAGAPAARDHHTAVWTGTEMIIWGGFASGIGTFFGDTFTYTPVRALYLYQRP